MEITASSDLVRWLYITIHNNKTRIGRLLGLAGVKSLVLKTRCGNAKREKKTGTNLTKRENWLYSQKNLILDREIRRFAYRNPSTLPNVSPRGSF